jgi:hypothetical protein
MRGKFSKLALFTAIACVVQAVPAIADEMPGTRFVSGNWRGAAYDTASRFSHCAMSAGYKSGITMFFSVSENWTWRIGWAHRDWKLPAGREIPITVSIDSFPPRQMLARVQRPDFALAELPAKIDIFDLFRKGYSLAVFAEGQRYAFNLDGTYAALTTLLQCVSQNRQFAASPPAKPTTAIPVSPPTPANSPRATAEQRLEATKMVANIMAQADLPGFRMLSDGEVKAIGNDFLNSVDLVWQAEGVLGTLRVLPKEPGKNIDDIASQILAEDSKACKGTFASGFTADDAGNAKRMFTACDSTLTTLMLRYTIVSINNDVVYLFTTTGRKGEQGNRDTIDKAEVSLRRAVFNVTGH